jgi:hypothetical protein
MNQGRCASETVGVGVRCGRKCRVRSIGRRIRHSTGPAVWYQLGRLHGANSIGTRPKRIPRQLSLVSTPSKDRVIALLTEHLHRSTLDRTDPIEMDLALNDPAVAGACLDRIAVEGQLLADIGDLDNELPPVQRTGWLC